MVDQPPAGWSPPPPPPPPGAGPAPYGAPPPGYSATLPAPPEAGKPPRPRVPIAGLLMLAGAVVIVIGTVLPWMKSGSFSANAWDVLADVDDDSSRGGGYAFFAAVLGGFGIATIAAGRVLAVAIIAVVVGAMVAIVAFSDISDLYELNDLTGIDVGIGPWVTTLGAMAALGGAIWTLSIRRRWR